MKIILNIRKIDRKIKTGTMHKIMEHLIIKETMEEEDVLIFKEEEIQEE